MKCHLIHALAAAGMFALSTAVWAQPAPPAMPDLTPEQSAQVNERTAAERATMEARVGRGEVTPDEAERYLAWREWQIAQQVAGVAPPPTAAVQGQLDSPPARRYAYAYPAPYYSPYYYYPAPYYWGPRYYGGPVVCAGGWGHHVAGRVCF